MEEKKNLLFLSLSSKKTIENSIHNYILKELKKHFENISVFCVGEKFIEETEGINYYSGNFSSWFGYLKKLNKLDAIYVNDYFVGGAFGSYVKRKKKARLVFRCGSAWRYELNSLSNIAKAILLECTKPLTSKSIANRKIKHDYSVVYNGVDTEKFSPQVIERPDEKFKVLYIGRMRNEKGLEYLFRAAKDLKDVSIICVGGGKHLFNYKKDFPFIHYLGRKTHEELPGIINAADVVILPSFTSSSESFPNALLEAMSCAKAVIGTRVWGIPEMIDDGENGLLIKEKSEKEILDAILRLKKDPAQLKEMGDKGREKVLLSYEKERQIQKLYMVLFENA